MLGLHRGERAQHLPPPLGAIEMEGSGELYPPQDYQRASYNQDPDSEEGVGVGLKG